MEIEQNTQQPELTEEQKNKYQELLKQTGKFVLRQPIKEIIQYVQSNGITIEDAIEEVKNKTSKLPRSKRSILLDPLVTIDILKEWIPSKFFKS